MICSIMCIKYVDLYAVYKLHVIDVHAILTFVVVYNFGPQIPNVT